MSFCFCLNGHYFVLNLYGTAYFQNHISKEFVYYIYFKSKIKTEIKINVNKSKKKILAIAILLVISSSPIPSIFWQVTWQPKWLTNLAALNSKILFQF